MVEKDLVHSFFLLFLSSTPAFNALPMAQLIGTTLHCVVKKKA